jgi:hypothetical protein
MLVKNPYSEAHYCSLCGKNGHMTSECVGTQQLSSYTSRLSPELAEIKQVILEDKKRFIQFLTNRTIYKVTTEILTEYCKKQFPNLVYHSPESCECSICKDILTPFQKDITWCKKCKDYYHEKCMVTWINRQVLSENKPTCPCCKGSWQFGKGPNLRKDLPTFLKPLCAELNGALLKDLAAASLAPSDDITLEVIDREENLRATLISYGRVYSQKQDAGATNRILIKELAHELGHTLYFIDPDTGKEVSYVDEVVSPKGKKNKKAAAEK